MLSSRQVNFCNSSCIHILSIIASTLLHGGSTRFTNYSQLGETLLLSDIMGKMANDNLSVDYVKQLLHNLQRDFQLLTSPIQVCLFYKHLLLCDVDNPTSVHDGQLKLLTEEHECQVTSHLSNFSHQSLLHLLSNMSFLLTLGKSVCEVLGKSVHIYHATFFVRQ